MRISVGLPFTGFADSARPGYAFDPYFHMEEMNEIS